jgi:hypothetical protein
MLMRGKSLIHPGTFIVIAPGTNSLPIGSAMLMRGKSPTCRDGSPLKFQAVSDRNGRLLDNTTIRTNPLDYGSAMPMRAKSLTCRARASSNSSGL